SIVGFLMIRRPPRSTLDTSSAAGSMVNDKTLVEGVSLTYKEGTKVYTSTQVGKECQFTTGLAVVITTTYNETRIQPNTKCPEKS
ncbi:hypothetical protein, partial [Staphylococcus aureus]